ncbi:NMDA receptor synaptonuclear signaling and neuronal migration factor isoform X3 [Anas acuta]|uniref:NMDA receptor synaptonuclear signaling and neuronal migration factor n=1 Tax=Anas zonorhyncha TaxID=75864 RepID=A0A8B9UZ76_9AVES|nr:NMDA receptor synaptonuclear signaling and neuronal migration factor isoform X5 [Anas platyrhynchos]|eukprot:XP_027326742.1 NMDA receptor synaptonuclear signaling and neuronal migration factor isoform X2 [Anas platyrhynchos]
MSAAPRANMGTAVSKRKTLRNEAMSSVAAKVRAARAFGEYLSQNHPEGRNGSDHLLADSYIGQEDSPEMQQAAQNKRRLSVISDGKFERSFSEEQTEKMPSEGPKPRVYTISGERPMLSDHENESMELVVMKGAAQEECHHSHHAHSAGGSHGVSRHCKGWPGSRQGSKECPNCSRLAAPSHHSFDLEQHQSGETGWHRKRLERMYSVDRVSDDVPIRTWFPKENLFSFQTATTTMQAAFRGYAERKRRKRENDSAAVIQRNFRKHLRMVGSRRVKAQTFAERRERSFSRSWSDPTPIKADSFHDSRESHDLQDSCGTLDGDFDLNWEAEKELEAMACDGEDFIPPKIMLISSKVPKAEYVPTIIRRDDPSIIPILYDHEHATFDDILEEIEKKLNIYRKGCKIWKMLIFCQGGPGHLYLLKNKVATFAKVEKEEDMILFWKRLSRLMSKVNPEPNIIHIMGCYVLGNPNGEKLFQNLKNLMNPYRVAFESPLELSAQGKQMIETYFDFRLYRLWKTRQHSKLLDYDDIL